MSLENILQPRNISIVQPINQALMASKNTVNMSILYANKSGKNVHIINYEDVNTLSLFTNLKLCTLHINLLVILHNAECSIGFMLPLSILYTICGHKYMV